MIRPGGAHSLGQRLSYWLALQSLVGLLVVCAAVYGATRYAFEARQIEHLNQKRDLILHLVSEATSNSDEALLRHKLEDFMVGQSEFGLFLQQADGQVFYERQLPPGGVARRKVRFDIASPLSSHAVFRAELSLDARNDTLLLRRIGVALLVAAVGGALLISFGGFLLVWLGLRPLRDLSAQVERLSANTLHRRLDGSHQPDELAPLIGQFNLLLARLDRSYEQLEGFNADVAHELLTPLATLTSGSELALRSSLSVDGLREMLGSNLEELERVSDIVHDMLFLSQADRGAAARRTTTPSLAVVARQVAAYHEAALADAGLSLEVSGDAAGGFDIALLQRGFSNLISNATRYGHPGSTVRVRIDETALDEVTVQVENQGDAVDPQTLSRMFDRFYRGDAARSNAHRNHGLGLAIVAAIARMHGGRPIASCAQGITAVGMVLKRAEDPPVAGAAQHD